MNKLIILLYEVGFMTFDKRIFTKHAEKMKIPKFTIKHYWTWCIHVVSLVQQPDFVPFRTYGRKNYWKSNQFLSHKTKNKKLLSLFLILINEKPFLSNRLILYQANKTDCVVSAQRQWKKPFHAIFYRDKLIKVDKEGILWDKVCIFRCH